MELPQHIAEFLLNRCQQIELDLEGKICSSDDNLFPASPFTGVPWVELFESQPQGFEASSIKDNPQEKSGIESVLGGLHGIFDFFFLPHNQGITVLIRDQRKSEALDLPIQNSFYAGPQPQAQKAESPNILLLEENPLSLRIASRLVEQLGYSVAVSSSQPTTPLPHAQIGVILVDINSDKLKSDTIISSLHESNPNIPLVGMTTSGLSVKDRRFDAFIRKPLKRQELASLLSNYLDPGYRTFPINLDYLSEITGKDPIRVAELLDIFLMEAPVTLRQMKQKAKNGQLGELRDLANRLQSNFRYLDAKEMIQLAQQIERFAELGTRKELLPIMVNYLESRSAVLSESLQRLKNRLI